VDDFDVLPIMDDSAFPYLDDAGLLAGRAEKLLAGELPEDTPADGVQELGSLLSALRAPARPQELNGQARAFEAFRAAKEAKEKAAAKEKRLAKEKTFAKEERTLRERSTVRFLPNHFGPKVGAATAVALLAFTGVAAAAVTGSLPAPLQSFVHARIGVIAGPPAQPAQPAQARSARTRAASSPSPAPSRIGHTTGPSAVPAPGPPAAGASRGGLCRAFENARGHSSAGKAAHDLELAAAAAGQTVNAYCAAFESGGRAGDGAGGKTAAPKPSDGQHGHGSGTSGNGGTSGGGHGGNGGSGGSGGSGGAGSGSSGHADKGHSSSGNAKR
jgi:hypothetical protein